MKSLAQTFLLLFLSSCLCLQAQAKEGAAPAKSPKAEGSPGLEITIKVPELPKPSKEAGPFGLGLLFGEPSGISAKLWLDGHSAVDGGIAWAFFNQSLALHADYLFHFLGVVKLNEEEIPPFIGAGAYMRIANSANRDPFRAGIRLPIGLGHRFSKIPLEISGELVPGIQLSPKSDFVLQGGIALRYYF